MKRTLLILFTALLLLLCSCSDKEEQVLNESVVKPEFTQQELEEKFGSDELFIVKTYMPSPDNEFERYLDENLIFTKIKHYQLSDGSWKTDEHSYKYKLKLTGRMNNAARDSTYEILSNNPDITFDMAWKASGYSSNLDDYFKTEDAVIVGIG